MIAFAREQNYKVILELTPMDALMRSLDRMQRRYLFTP